MPRSWSTTLVVLAVSGALSPLAAQTYDAVGDYSMAANPNGPWSYGSSPSPGGAVTLYTVADSSSGGFSGLDVRNFGGFLAGPFLIRNASGADIGAPFGFTLPPSLLGLHPSYSAYSVVRWTAPTAARHCINGALKGSDLASTGVSPHRRHRPSPILPLKTSCEPPPSGHHAFRDYAPARSPVPLLRCARGVI